jgi:ferric hydroxamate transport system substrate-binding protein
MFRLYRTLLFLCLLVTLLAGCTTNPSAPSGTIQPPATSGAPLTITHALGETEVPANPQRVVALEWTYIEDLLALGVQPVGVADIAGYEAWVQIPVELGDDVVDVGTRQAPNLETLAALQPDLILVPAFRAAETYEQLAAIAPTLAFDSYPTDENVTQYDEMRQTFLTIAEVVGRRA